MSTDRLQSVLEFKLHPICQRDYSGLDPISVRNATVANAEAIMKELLSPEGRMALFHATYDSDPEQKQTRFRVVLNRNIQFGASGGETFSFETARQLALDYWMHAEDGWKVQIYYPTNSQDAADYSWTKGVHLTRDIMEAK
jgi:hypothetical protein